MMKSSEVFHLFRSISGIPLNRGICTSSVLLRRRVVPRNIPNEPGIRNRKASFQDDFDEQIEHEDEFESEVDIMNIDRAYDANESEKKENKKKVQFLMTSRKFFSPRAQPLMLTSNERHCIRYLHKEDPVQWDVKTLSESFPATTDTIKKIIKGKWKITPERAKVMDSKAQRNWELLAEGKLDADPHVLEHLKKFVNRREVLLEQIKNSDFYLPEVKKEPIWNKGEFSGLLTRYEKTIEKLVKETEMKQQQKMLEDGVSTDERKDKSSLDCVHEKINEEVSLKKLENKDSFLFGELNKFYSKHMTLEDLEEKVLKRADKGKNLDMMEKAILENKLGVTSKPNLENLPEVPESSTPRSTEGNANEGFKGESKHFVDTNRKDESSSARRRKVNRRLKESEVKIETITPPPDERTKVSSTTGVGKLLMEIRGSHKTMQTDAEDEQKNVEVKPQIDFTDPERLQKENLYYNKEVDAIRNTAFWNSGRSSDDKAVAELQKYINNGPDMSKLRTSRPTTAILSEDRYPERIKVPKHMRRSGLTFKVKDCYYDDDGEFLYRVPGMMK